MKFCPVVPEICCGQVHVPRKERKEGFVVKGVKVIFGGVQRGWGLL
jgi:hypothetical protein